MTKVASTAVWGDFQNVQTARVLDIIIFIDRDPTRSGILPGGFLPGSLDRSIGHEMVDAIIRVV
jgi:hypothetical protein